MNVTKFLYDRDQIKYKCKRKALTCGHICAIILEERINRKRNLKECVSMKFCPYCGSELGQNKKTCNTCKKELTSPSKLYWIPLVIGFILLFLQMIAYAGLEENIFNEGIAYFIGYSAFLELAIILGIIGILFSRRSFVQKDTTNKICIMIGTFIICFYFFIVSATALVLLFSDERQVTEPFDMQYERKHSYYGLNDREMDRDSIDKSL